MYIYIYKYIHMIFFDDQFNPNIAIIFCSLFACIFLRFLDLVWAKNLQESHPIWRVTMVSALNFPLNQSMHHPVAVNHWNFHDIHKMSHYIRNIYIYHRYTTLNHQTFDNLKSTQKFESSSPLSTSHRVT